MMAKISHLERIARSIAEQLGNGDWEDFVEVARAAVTALREPTREMLEAAEPYSPGWGQLPEDWRKMIDFVLTENNETSTHPAKVGSFKLENNTEQRYVIRDFHRDPAASEVTRRIPHTKAGLAK